MAGSAELGAGPRDVRYVDPDPRISGRAIFIDNGSTLLYAITEKGVANLWTQPLNGRPGHQITNFALGQIASYDVTPDAKSLFVARYQVASDIVLLRDTTAQQ